MACGKSAKIVVFFLAFSPEYERFYRERGEVPGEDPALLPAETERSGLQLREEKFFFCAVE